jgi:glycosyltransferase involved in cell wall biosynthesis
MRLLLFNHATDEDHPVWGVGAAWIRALAPHCGAIAVVTMRAGRVDAPPGVSVRSLGGERGYSRPRRLVRFYRHLLAVLREERVDACFSHMTPLFTVMAAPLLRMRGIPVATWYLHPASTPTLRAAHRVSDAVVSATTGTYPYRHDKLVPLGHGIDTALFAPDDTGDPATPPLVLCAGRLSPVKDHLTLIDATRRLRERAGLRCRVVIIGGPATPRDVLHADRLRREVEHLGLAEWVRFEPAVPMRALVPWYRRAAVHVNLAPGGFLDKTALEAMSCGRPSLVASEAFRDTLGPHADLLLFRPGDPGGLAERLERVLSLPREDQVALGRDVRTRVIAAHGLERLAAQLVQLLGSLAGRGPGPAARIDIAAASETAHRGSPRETAGA